MKYLTIGLVILGLLAAGCLWSGRAIRTRTEAVIRPLEEAEAAAAAGDADIGRRCAARAALEWARCEGLLSSLLSHEHTNAVGAALAELEELPDGELARACGRLIRALRELAGQDAPRWRNVL
ncbi:MAG: hypothetical protein IKI02_02145 [Oscillospiraceae bacterium]|nr:hypothetical protein [Oscillospiraceae bacterium]